jgi:hypothetical protein
MRNPCSHRPRPLQSGRLAGPFWQKKHSVSVWDVFPLSLFLITLHLLLPLTTPAQTLRWQASTEWTWTTYSDVAQVNPWQNGAVSPAFALTLDLPVQDSWAYFRTGLTYTFTIQRRPHFRNYYHWLGVPVSLVLHPWPGREMKVRPIFRSQYLGSLLFSASQRREAAKDIRPDTHFFRGEWSVMPGVELYRGERRYELGLLAGFSNPINESHYQGLNMPALVGVRWGLMVGLGLP